MGTDGRKGFWNLWSRTWESWHRDRRSVAGLSESTVGVQVFSDRLATSCRGDSLNPASSGLSGCSHFRYAAAANPENIVFEKVIPPFFEQKPVAFEEWSG